MQRYSSSNLQPAVYGSVNCANPDSRRRNIVVWARWSPNDSSSLRGGFSARGYTSFGIHFRPANRGRDRKDEICKGERALPSQTSSIEWLGFLFFLLFSLAFLLSARGEEQEDAIRRTAYVQRTNGSSCACVEYLTWTPPRARRITLNGKAAAAAADMGATCPPSPRPRRTNQGEAKGPY